MSKHFTERQRKRIIADRVEGMTLRSLAAKYGVSRYAIEKIIKADPEFNQKLTAKKEQNELDMIEFLESRKVKAQQFVDLALDQLQNPAKLDKASVQTIATALGIVIDKFAPVQKRTDEDKVTIVWGK